MSWKELARAFDNPKIARRHEGWHSVLNRCAIFDVDIDQGRSLNDGDIGLPLPFPQFAHTRSWSTVVTDEFWFNEDDLVLGANLLCIARPYDEFDFWVLLDGRVSIRFYDHQDDLTVDGLRTTCVSNAKIVHDSTLNPDSKAVLEGTLSDLIRTVAYIHHPTRFIVKSSPGRLPKPVRGKVPRLYQRPRYIVIDKDEIQTRYHDSQPKGGKSPMPHLRRGHYRTLAANIYKEPGKRVWVRATHVKGNTVEWREGDRQYKVI